MGRLLNGIPVKVNGGDVVISIKIGTGTAAIDYDGDGFGLEPLVAVTAESDKVIATLSTGTLRAVLTGDAKASVNGIPA